jgi:hypothetical protein
MAHKCLYSLQPVTAEKILRIEELKNPDNGYVPFYRLYSEAITLMISNSPDQYKKKASIVSKYVEKLEDLPDNAPDYRLLLGEAKVIAGLLNVKYDSKFSGLMECLKGYNLLEENAKKYPLFEPDGKIPAMLKIGVAFMPKILQWGVKLLGIKSNPQEGLRELADYERFAKGKPGYEEEAFLFTMAAFKLMGQEEEALNLIHAKMKDIKEITLLNYLAATVCNDANESETTLILLSNIVPEKLEMPFPALLYITGKTKMLLLDPDSNIPLMDYLKQPVGIDYLKSTLYDLACYNYISGNIPEYRNYIEQVKEKGRELHNRDIEAAFEAKKSGFPNIYLMKVDFLVKGGYALRAEAELSKIVNINTLKENEKVQYNYLRGECKRLENKVKEAESAYRIAINSGKVTGDYFAQKAMVQSGLMMEKNGFKQEAKKYYDLCLQFKAVSNPYSDLYNNKAKAGLIRLSLSR